MNVRTVLANSLWPLITSKCISVCISRFHQPRSSRKAKQKSDCIKQHEHSRCRKYTTRMRQVLCRFAQRSGKLSSCLQVCCFWTSQQSESVLFHVGCHPSQVGASTLQSEENAHQFQLNLDLILNNFGFF